MTEAYQEMPANGDKVVFMSDGRMTGYLLSDSPLSDEDKDSFMRGCYQGGIMILPKGMKFIAMGEPERVVSAPMEPQIQPDEAIFLRAFYFAVGVLSAILVALAGCAFTVTSIGG